VPIEQALSIRGRANTLGVAPLVAEMDELGLRDSIGRYFSPYVSLSWPLLVGSISSFVWHCHEGLWQVNSVSTAHTVVGGAGAAASVIVCPQAVAIGSGVAQQTAVSDLTITAPAYRFATLIASPTVMSRGDALAVLMAGTLTGLVGVMQILVKRIG
jgi:hypothetical protein